nr:MAG TPA: hypothetical protein [Caudoviricetes sp.]
MFYSAKLGNVGYPNKKSVKDLHSFLPWRIFRPILHCESAPVVGALHLIL